MTKKEFCECMGLIKNQYDKCEKINDGIYSLFGGGDKLWNTLNVNTEIAILTKAMGDTEEWIDYYIYDCKWGEDDNNVCIDGKVVPFRTYEDLYEVIKGDNDKRNEETNNTFMEALKQNFEDIKKEEKINFDIVKMRGDV